MLPGLYQFVVAVARCYPVWRGGGEDDQSTFSAEGMGEYGAGGERRAMDARRMLARKIPTTANFAYEEQATDVRKRVVGVRYGDWC